MSDRRTVLSAILGLSLEHAVGSAPALARPLPQQKRTKQQVNYQGKPKDVRSCGTCSYFDKPNRCSVLEGEVSEDGYCDLYAMID